MAIRFTATLNAFNRGIEKLSPKQAVNMIEDWETALAELDVPGSKSIARDLGSLRRQLEAASPDEGRVTALLGRLGDAVERISGRAETSGDRLKQLGEALADAGEPIEDESEDAAAAAAPVRRRKTA
jgi:ABC-type transporter Mla subunit MlaD